MIQRIQSVYLLLVVVLLVIGMCMPVGRFLLADGQVASFTNLGVTLGNEANTSSWGLFAILLLSAFIALATIFLFKNRILQIRLTIFNSILLVGYYITFLTFMFVFRNHLDASYQLGWGICFPLVCLILNYLAIRAIGSDEVMVKAADRLR